MQSLLCIQILGIGTFLASSVMLGSE